MFLKLRELPSDRLFFFKKNSRVDEFSEEYSIGCDDFRSSIFLTANFDFSLLDFAFFSFA